MERFKKPTTQQLIDFAIIFNEGKIDKRQLANMVAMCELILDRLQEHGDVMKKSSKED